MCYPTVKQTSWSFCNDKFTVGAKGDPLGLKDYPSTTGVSYENKPAKGEFKAKLNFDVSTPDMSGVRLWENVSQKIQL